MVQEIDRRYTGRWLTVSTVGKRQGIYKARWGKVAGAECATLQVTVRTLELASSSCSYILSGQLEDVIGRSIHSGSSRSCSVMCHSWSCWSWRAPMYAWPLTGYSWASLCEGDTRGTAMFGSYLSLKRWVLCRIPPYWLCVRLVNHHGRRTRHIVALVNSDASATVCSFRTCTLRSEEA